MSRHVFVHVGDAHVCASHPRNADRLASLDQIIEAGRAVAGRFELAAWLWPGDLFHQRSTPADRNALAERLQLMAANAPVIVTVGNHETAEDLEIFARLDSAWPILVVTTPRLVRFETATGAQAACFALPYPHKAGLVAAGVAHADLIQEAADCLDPIFMLAASQLAEAAFAGQIPLFIGHVNVGGAVTSVGQPSIGKEIELNPAHLARLGPICKALNHIHKHQTIAGAVYAGSTSRHDYGEMEEKGFVEWTFDDSLFVLELTDSAWSWRFVPLTTPRQVHVEGRLSRAGFSFLTINSIDAAEWERSSPYELTGADIRCRYTFVQAEISALDVAHVHAAFAGCRSLKLDPVPELAHEVRAPEVAAAVTLEDKVQRYAEHRGLTVTPGLLAKLTALQQPDGAAVLSEVAGHLAAAGAEPIDVELRERAVA